MRAVLGVVAIWLVSLGAAAQFGKFAVVFDRIAAAYPGQPGPMIGLVVSAVGFAGLIFGTTAGLIVSGLGYRRVMTAALLAGAAVSAVQALWPPLPLMLALRLVEGGAHLAIVVSAPVLTAQLASPRWQPAAMALYSSFFGVSFMVLGYLGPPLVAQIGLGGLFAAHAAYMAAGAGLIALILPADPPRRAVALAPRGLLAQHARIYASPFEAAPAMGFVCYTITYVAFLTLMPQVFVGRPEQGLLAVALPLVSVAVSMTLGIWALSRFSAVAVACAGFAAAVACALALWLVWAAPMPTVIAAMGVAASLGLVQSASFAAIPQLNPAPEGRARAAGAIAQLGNVGTTSGTPLLVWLIAQGGATGLALFLGGISALGIGIHAIQARRRAAAGGLRA